MFRTGRGVGAHGSADKLPPIAWLQAANGARMPATHQSILHLWDSALARAVSSIVTSSHGAILLRS
jgi:hypothetical protein